MDAKATILTLNGGSSSLKFALHAVATGARVVAGKIDRLGSDRAVFSLGGQKMDLGRLDHRAGTLHLLDWLGQRDEFACLVAVGHRIVHGGPRYRRPARLDTAMLDSLRQLTDYAPEHLPAELAMIEACIERLPDVAQIACFDTAFHRDLPSVSRLLPIPRRFAETGVERYGFHGLSYAFLMQELRRVAGADAAGGRVILAHLGNGASLAAVKAGRSIDTTMGFTPAAGIAMGTRAGDLDPGLVLYLAKREGMDAKAFDHMVNHEAGLLGLSGTSGDIRDLLAREPSDHRAGEAIALFCYQIRKAIGALAAALGGVDTLVFSGGIGENAAVIRSRICQDLGFLGINLDPTSNDQNEPLISTGAVAVRVIPTDEEAVMVEAVRTILQNKDASA